MTAATVEAAGGRTFGSEDGLPRVPLPTLEESCQRFLDWCAPLLDAAELGRTRQAVTEFLRPGSAAWALQDALARDEAAALRPSWLDEFWPDRYLGRRNRIAVNANYFFLFHDTGRSQVDRAAALAVAATGYKLALDAELIPPAAQRGRPLSMEQQKFLFATTRIPGADRDTIRAPYTADRPGPSRARHIVVLRHGRIFALEVVDDDGRARGHQAVADGLRDVLRLAPAPAPVAESVGYLTTKARAEWAASRQALLAGAPSNADVLETVESALFCVCLDDAAPHDIHAACDALLHGGSAAGAGNRWFDKALSLVVFGDGRAGINVEHCGLDGTTMLSFVDALLAGGGQERPAAASGAPVASPVPGPAAAASDDAAPVAAVEFVLDAALRADVTAAAADFAAFVRTIAATLCSVEDFGADVAKALRVSPDAFVQLGYQLAHRRARGRLGATYESIATRQYRGGRTEAMRVVTPEIGAFVAAMDDPDADVSVRAAALRAAADAHVARAKQCQAGQAPEQHLWELQLLQRRRGADLGATEPLALYDSPGWRILRDDYLSTSSAPSPNIDYFGFGATSGHCIGVGYVLLADSFHLYLSAPAALADELAAFAREVPRAVEQMRSVLAGS